MRLTLHFLLFLIFSFQILITLKEKSVILFDKIRMLDRDKFKDKIGEIDDRLMEEMKRKSHFVLAFVENG
jgi:mRNA-degrading endonuclease toxin of MazEF toxin-antitoxin module